MKKILIATHNESKKKELLYGLKGLMRKGLQAVTLNDLNINDEPEETGKTFQQNSMLKAKFYANLTYLPTIADDGGLIIPYLNNEPGVKSRRWPGYEASDEELIKYTLSHLKGVIGVNRTAYLETCVCFYDPVAQTFACEQERIKGRISEKPLNIETKGYPFRTLFIVEKYNKYYDELTKEEHEKENHRLKALKRLVKRIEKNLIE